MGTGPAGQLARPGRLAARSREGLGRAQGAGSLHLDLARSGAPDGRTGGLPESSVTGRTSPTFPGRPSTSVRGKVESSIVVVVSIRDHGSVLDRRDLSPSEENVNVGKQLITYYVIAQVRVLFLCLSRELHEGPPVLPAALTRGGHGMGVQWGRGWESPACALGSPVYDDTVTWICFTGRSCCHRPQTGREGGLGDAGVASWHRASGSEAH